jgi:hypothetical protein
MSFELWMHRVNVELVKLCGMRADDIDDWRYRDDYEDGKTPETSARRALRNAKRDSGM